MAYNIDETVILPARYESCIAQPDGDHLLQRNKVQQPLEIRDKRIINGRREIAFKYIRGFHPEWCFTGKGTESEILDFVMIDGVLRAQPRFSTKWAPVLTVIGATERGATAGVDIATLDGQSGKASYVVTGDGVLIDDFNEDDKLSAKNDGNAQRIRTAIAYADGTLDPETILLCVIPEKMTLAAIANTNGAGMRWQQPEDVLHMSRKFGIEETSIIARTTYSNLVDPIAAARNHGTGAVKNLSLVALPSFDSIDWDTPAGDDQRTLAAACASGARYVD